MLVFLLQEGCNGEVVCRQACHRMHWHESLQFLCRVSSVALAFRSQSYQIFPNRYIFVRSIDRVRASNSYCCKYRACQIPQFHTVQSMMSGVISTVLFT